jgi:hypothetical protein
MGVPEDGLTSATAAIAHSTAVDASAGDAPHAVQLPWHPGRDAALLEELSSSSNLPDADLPQALQGSAHPSCTDREGDVMSSACANRPASMAKGSNQPFAWPGRGPLAQPRVCGASSRPLGRRRRPSPPLPRPRGVVHGRASTPLPERLPFPKVVAAFTKSD